MDTGNASMARLASQMCNHIASIFSKPTNRPPALNLMVVELTSIASHLYGVGREGLVLKAPCMSLAHLGLSAYFVFDMTTPSITSSDLLIASVGPGGFSTVDSICSIPQW
ncbi:hypothetical protein CRYUN_Cryun12cG0096300 [Craigia yunnanensis]